MSASDSHLAYGPHPLHTFDLHLPPSRSGPAWIVFVHGGAWRSEDKADHAALAKSLVARTGCAVAVPNYRLTQLPQAPHRHPSHAEDVLAFLHHALAFSGAHGGPPKRLYVLGHSCAAHILASIFQASPHPSLTPSAALCTALRALVLSEGIYDVDALLRSFPGYREWFIANTFGERESYSAENVAAYAPREGTEHVRWFLVHSKGDVLVDQLQADLMHAHLLEHAGKVDTNFDVLTENHNELLKGEVYPQIVGDYICGLEQAAGVKG